jgi:hypothetical protein
MTTEIHEAQQQNVTEGDRRRSKSTALTTENCGVFNKLLGSLGIPSDFDFSTFAKKRP